MPRMDTVNIYEAKTKLSQLVERAAGGEEIVIAKAGKPMARLVPIERRPPRQRKLGLLEGKVRIGDDFNDPLPDEVMKAFLGEGD